MFLKNKYFICGNWAGMTLEYSRICLQPCKSHFGFKTILKSPFWDLKTDFWMFQVHILDLNASNASELFHIIGPQCLQCLRAIPYFGPRGTATTTAAAAAATAAVSQELWNLGGALVQRAQEQNIPCGESLTSTVWLEMLGRKLIPWSVKYSVHDWKLDAT